MARPDVHETDSVVPLPGSAKNSRLTTETSPRTLVTGAGLTAAAAAATTCAGAEQWQNAGSFRLGSRPAG
jgi:hypothetical protein